MTSTIIHYNELEHIFIDEYNSTIKIYSNGLVKIKRNSFSTLKGIYRENRHTGTMSEDEKEEKTKKYLKKVKTNIVDLAINYDKWEYFITLTFDNEKFENGKYSHEQAIDYLKKWINNQKHQNRQMTYLLVPEFHKESGKLHFHGLISNVPKWKFTEARYPEDYKKDKLRGKLIIKNGLQIYNLDNYDLGFTTISEVQDQEKVSNYISKYATKELITLKSKRRYWYSRNLEKPQFKYDYIESNLKEYLKGIDLRFYKSFDSDFRSIEVADYIGQHNL